jgi:hypothetical protein
MDGDISSRQIDLFSEECYLFETQYRETFDVQSTSLSFILTVLTYIHIRANTRIDQTPNRRR